MVEEPVAASRFCNLCGQRLAGHYYRNVRGLVFCATCSATRTHCARCDTPLPEATASRGREAHDPPLCTPCARKTPRCAACKRHVVGTFYTFEELLPPAAVRRFCDTCMRTRPRCDICRVPVAPDIAPLDDGQYRCTLCLTDMVLGESAVHAVYREALAALAQVMGMPFAEPRLAVVSRIEMGEIRRRHESATREGETPPAAGQHILGYFVQAHGTQTIYVERGLPRGLLLGTLAHELGHAWQAPYAPKLRDPLLTEGFAEWVAHFTLVAGGLRTIAASATRRDDIYGQGLRRMLAVERTSGREGVLAVARGEKAASG